MTSKVWDQCGVKGCRREAHVTYMGHPVCWFHWDMHCSRGSNFNLKVELGLLPGASNLPAVHRG